MTTKISKLLPMGMAAFAAENPNKEVTAMARARASLEDKLAAQSRLLSTARNVEILHSIQLVSFKARLHDVCGLMKSADCDYIWIVNERIEDVYISLVRGIDNMLRSAPPSIVNLSIAPPSELLPMPFRPYEPINLATKALFDAGGLAIIAAGNGGPAENSINPWSTAPWVVSVGAASSDGTQLSVISGVGSSQEIERRPTVVAPGMDLQLPYWVAPNGEKFLDKEEAPEGSVEHLSRKLTGTSYAVPQVTKAASHLYHFLNTMHQQLLEQGDAELDKDGSLWFAQIYIDHSVKKRDERSCTARLVGEIIDSEGTVVRYPTPATPLTVKQILIDLAIDMPDYQPYQIGAGFLHPAAAAFHFGTFGQVESDFEKWEITTGCPVEDDRTKRG